MSKLPNWIIAAAVVTIAVRYTVWPPCCTPTQVQSLSWSPRFKLDSVIVVVDTSLFAVRDTLVISGNDSVKVLGRRPAVLPLRLVRP